MDERTLTALKGSIAKWEAIVAGTDNDRGAKNCTLCQAFPDCDGCPVAEETGQDDCEGSPYEETRYFEARSDANGTYLGRAPVTPEDFAIARAELDFLRSLLPPEG